MKILGKFLQWVVSVPVNFAVELGAIILAPLAVAIGKVPQWMLTSDNPITGDEGHEKRWEGKPEYLKKVAWLWRNKAYGFTQLNADDAGNVAKVYGQSDVSNRPWKPGWQLRVTDNGYWQFYAILPYKNRYARINLGWKLWSGANYGQYVCTVNPVAKL